jgi:DNA-binding transcriptional LysR family regulator
MATLNNFRLVVYLTQPAISLQIKALEEDLSVQLFDRSGAHIALTRAASALLGCCERVGKLLAHAERDIAALSGEHAGQPALGASTTIAQYVLPGFSENFSSSILVSYQR